jgi:O-antigen/teichoic acid export membrane protein
MVHENMPAMDSTSEMNTHGGDERARPAQISKRRAISGSSWAFFGFGGEQAIRFVRSLFLTRLLAPEFYGLIGLSGIVVGLIARFSDIGLNISIIRDKRGEDQRFLDTAWTLSVLRGVIIWLVACAIAWPASRIYEEPLLLYVIPIIGLSAVIRGFTSTKIATRNRKLVLGRLTVLRILAQALGLSTTVAWAMYDPENIGVLVVGTLVSSLFIMVTSFVSLSGRGNRLCWDKEAVHELIRFGKWIVVSTAITFFLAQGDQAIVGVIQTTEAFAVYSVAYFLARAIPKVLLNMGPKVLLPVYAQMDENNLKQVRRRTFKMRAALLGVFLPVMWSMVLFGRYLVWWLYPESYHNAGWMFELLTAGNVGLVIGLTAGGVVLARGDSFRFMILQTARAITMLTGMGVGYMIGKNTGAPDGGIMGFIIGMGVSYWLNYPLLVWAIRKHGTWLPGLDGVAFAGSAVVVYIRFWVMQ